MQLSASFQSAVCSLARTPYLDLFKDGWGSQDGSLSLERHQAGIRDDFSVPLVPQVQCCELLWITFARGEDAVVGFGH